MTRPPYYPYPGSAPVNLGELDGARDETSTLDAPAGIPADLWSVQTHDAYVETYTGNGAGVRIFPGALLLRMQLPRKYARPWRIVLSKLVNGAARGAGDPYLRHEGLGAGYTPITPTTYPPTAPDPLDVDAIAARAVLRLGSDVVTLDWPGRGAVYTISAHNLELYILEDERFANAARRCTAHAVIQEGDAAPSWNLPTFTTYHDSVPAPVGVETYLMTAIPPRAVALRFMCNDVNPMGGVPLPPFGVVEWWDGSGGNLMESFPLQNGSAQINPGWIWNGNYCQWAVPPGASFFVVRRPQFSGGNEWHEPRIVWQLSI